MSFVDPIHSSGFKLLENILMPATTLVELSALAKQSEEAIKAYAAEIKRIRAAVETEKLSVDLQPLMLFIDEALAKLVTMMQHPEEMQSLASYLLSLMPRLYSHNLLRSELYGFTDFYQQQEEYKLLCALQLVITESRFFLTDPVNVYGTTLAASQPYSYLPKFQKLLMQPLLLHDRSLSTNTVLDFLNDAEESLCYSFYGLWFLNKNGQKIRDEAIKNKQSGPFLKRQGDYAHLFAIAEQFADLRQEEPVLFLQKAEDCTITDEQGNKILQLNSTIREKKRLLAASRQHSEALLEWPIYMDSYKSRVDKRNYNVVSPSVNEINDIIAPLVNKIQSQRIKAIIPNDTSTFNLLETASTTYSTDSSDDEDTSSDEDMQSQTTDFSTVSNDSDNEEETLTAAMQQQQKITRRNSSTGSINSFYSAFEFLPEPSYARNTSGSDPQVSIQTDDAPSSQKNDDPPPYYTSEYNEEINDEKQSPLITLANSITTTLNGKKNHYLPRHLQGLKLALNTTEQVNEKAQILHDYVTHYQKSLQPTQTCFTFRSAATQALYSNLVDAVEQQQTYDNITADLEAATNKRKFKIRQAAKLKGKS